MMFKRQFGQASITLDQDAELDPVTALVVPKHTLNSQSKDASGQAIADEYDPYEPTHQQKATLKNVQSTSKQQMQKDQLSFNTLKRLQDMGNLIPEFQSNEFNPNDYISSIGEEYISRRRSETELNGFFSPSARPSQSLIDAKLMMAASTGSSTVSQEELRQSSEKNTELNKEEQKNSIGDIQEVDLMQFDKEGDVCHLNDNFYDNYMDDSMKELDKPRMPAHCVDFQALWEQEKFEFRMDRELRKSVEKAVNMGFDAGLNIDASQSEAVRIRQAAYCLIFGLKQSDLKESFAQQYSELLAMSKQKADIHEALKHDCPCQKLQKHEHNQCRVIEQIKKDVHRTMSIFSTEAQQKIGLIPPETGNNPIYNLLVAYSEWDQEVGYTQGMNFLIGVIYIAIQDEVMCFAIILKIMHELQWRTVYQEQLVRLMELTKQIKQWLKQKHKVIAVHMDACGIILEAQLSSPFMGLFANMLPMEYSIQILDRFVYYGERALLEIIKNVFITQKTQILDTQEPFELQIYMTRQIYFDAIEKGMLFPSIRDMDDNRRTKSYRIRGESKTQI